MMGPLGNSRNELRLRDGRPYPSLDRCIKIGGQP